MFKLSGTLSVPMALIASFAFGLSPAVATGSTSTVDPIYTDTPQVINDEPSVSYIDNCGYGNDSGVRSTGNYSWKEVIWSGDTRTDIAVAPDGYVFRANGQSEIKLIHAFDNTECPTPIIYLDQPEAPLPNCDMAVPNGTIYFEYAVISGNPRGGYIVKAMPLAPNIQFKDGVRSEWPLITHAECGEPPVEAVPQQPAEPTVSPTQEETIPPVVSTSPALPELNEPSDIPASEEPVWIDNDGVDPATTELDTETLATPLAPQKSAVPEIVAGKNVGLNVQTASSAQDSRVATEPRSFFESWYIVVVVSLLGAIAAMSLRRRFMLHKIRK